MKEIKSVTLRLHPETAAALQKLLKMYDEKSATKVLEKCIMQHVFYIDKNRELEDVIMKQEGIIDYLEEQLKTERG